jgi:hypothetical protein
VRIAPPPPPPPPPLRGIFGADRLRALDRIARGVLLLCDVRGFMQQQLVALGCPCGRRTARHDDVRAGGEGHRAMLRRRLGRCRATVDADCGGIRADALRQPGLAYAERLAVTELGREAVEAGLDEGPFADLLMRPRLPGHTRA